MPLKIWVMADGSSVRGRKEEINSISLDRVWRLGWSAGYDSEACIWSGSQNRYQLLISGLCTLEAVKLRENGAHPLVNGSTEDVDDGIFARRGVGVGLRFLVVGDVRHDSLPVPGTHINYG
jgi:hypothetical protein